MRVASISLILATVGRTTELDRLFNSLAAQTMLDFEVVVVDQNSDARLLPHLERASSLGIVVKHLPHRPPNLAAARNAGIAAASGEWLGFPDDDCWYDSRLLERIRASGRRGRVGHGAPLDGAAADGGSPDGVIARWVEQPASPVMAPALSWARSRVFRDIPVSSITLFVRRSLFERMGGFDSRFGIGQWYGAAEETDLVLRALRNGAALAYDPGAEVHHAFGHLPARADAPTRLAERRRARGTGALYAKHGLPLWVVARGLVSPMLRPLLRGAFGAELALGWAIARGRLDGLLGWNRRES